LPAAQSEERIVTTPTDTTSDPYTPAKPVPLVWPATPVRVYRLAFGVLERFPNVRALWVMQREGADPGSALFDYDWTYPDSRAPQTVEQAITTGGTPPDWTILEGDRLVVKMQRINGDWEIVFDGLALTWRVGLNRAAETVYVTAVGIAHRLNDTPCPGQVIRYADDLDPGTDVPTDVRCQFNPRGQPNAIPDGVDKAGAIVGMVDGEYKTFVDPLIIRDPEIRAFWTLNESARYLCQVNNPTQTYVTNPDGAALDALLVSKLPISGTVFNPNDDTTYTVEPIISADTPFTGKDWVGFLKDLIGDYGFGLTYDLTASDTGELTGMPKTTLALYGTQDATPLPLFLQARGSPVDRRYTNTLTADVERDLAAVANVITVEGELEEFEASLVLWCGFPCTATDAFDPTAWGVFCKSSPNYHEHPSAYRLFVFDETGDGHYVMNTNTELNDTPTLDPILGAPVGTPAVPQYTHRRRPPIGDLISLDETTGIKHKWQVHLSTNYASVNGEIWDGTGDWFPVTKGIELLKDRLGIRITCDDPNAWSIGELTAGVTSPLPDGMVCRVVEACNNKNGAPLFSVRLTVRFQGDARLKGTVARRAASPITRDITRTIDAHDRFRKQTVCASSIYNITGSDEVFRDDTADAVAEATAVQLMTEAGRLDAPFTLDHLTTFYGIGDRISGIVGRNTPLRTDGGGSGENPILPVVTGRKLVFYPQQLTELETTDAGSSYTRYQRAQKHSATASQRHR
jgi:hypothetical protein